MQFGGMNQGGMGGAQMGGMGMPQMGGMGGMGMPQMGGMDMSGMGGMGMSGMGGMGMPGMAGMGMPGMAGTTGQTNNNTNISIEDAQGWNLIFENQNDKTSVTIRISEQKFLIFFIFVHHFIIYTVIGKLP